MLYSWKNGTMNSEAYACLNNKISCIKRHLIGLIGTTFLSYCFTGWFRRENEIIDVKHWRAIKVLHKSLTTISITAEMKFLLGCSLKGLYPAVNSEVPELIAWRFQRKRLLKENTEQLFWSALSPWLLFLGITLL